jgi:uncharacterized membrane protein
VASLAVTSYGVVLALHIVAVISAYGLPLAYPMLLPYVRRHYPEAMPGVHDVQHRLNVRLATPASVLIVAFGVYMTQTRHYWDEVWVLVPLGFFAVISLVGATYIVPVSHRMAELARTDVSAKSAGVVDATSPSEYDQVYKRYLAVEGLLGVFVLAAIFFMAAKPFA